MSSNNILGKIKPVSLIELKTSLKREELNYKNASYAEELKEIEFFTINIEESLKKLKEAIVTLNEFDQLDIETNSSLNRAIDTKMNLLYEKKKYLEEIYTQYRNRTEVLKKTLSGKSKEIRQKLSSLDNLKDEIKFNLTESFENLYDINFDGIKTPRMEITTNSKVATLPEEGVEICRPNKIFLGSKSNGVTGSYGDNSYGLPYYLIDSDEETFFEYHREDNGPLVCEITFDFNQEYIINSFEIKKNNKSSGEDIRLESIIYTQADGASLKLEQLVNLDYQNTKIETVNNSGELLIKHLPAKATRATVFLVQETPNVSFIEGNIKNIYSICIEKIAFKQIKYFEKGSFRSNNQVSPEGYYNLFAHIKSHPENSVGFSSKLNLSLDGGGEYTELPFDGSKTKSLISDGTQKNINYEYICERSFIENKEDIEKESLLKTYSIKKKITKTISEDEIPLNDKYLKNSLNVVERIVSRSNNLDKAISIATSFGKDTVKANLPFVLSDEKVFKEDLEIYVNGLKTSNYVLDSNMQSISLDFTGEDNNNLKRIKALLKPYTPEIVIKPEGYYISVPETFDYDLENITIKSYKNAERYKEIIPSGTKEFYTKYKNLDKVLFKDSEQNTVPEIIESSSLEEGHFVFNEELTEKHTIIYIYKKEVKVNDFYIWFGEEKPAGLFIPQNSFSGNTVKETLQGVGNTYQLNEKNVILNSIVLDAEDFPDKYQEVRYIDGKSEFLNLARMSEEKIPAIETEDGLVEFRLSKTNVVKTEDIFLYKSGSTENYDVVFGAPDVPALNTLYILEDNTCILSIEEGSISEDLYIDYWYSSKSDTTKKFSVNSKAGTIHFSSNIEGGKLKYQTGRLEIEYDIVNYLDSSSDDRKVTFRTNNMYKNRNVVKAIWGIPVGNIDYSQVEEYYSPIIYEVMIGMN